MQAKAADAAGREIVVRVHPDFAGYLESQEREALERLAHACDLKVTIQRASTQSAREDYEIHVR